MVSVKTLALQNPYETLSGTARPYLDTLLKVYVPSRRLHSINDRRLVVPTQRRTDLQCGGPSESAEPVTISKKHLKTHLFGERLTNP